MKINSRMHVREVAGEHIVIMQGDGGADMTKVVALNPTALLLYNKLRDKDFTVDDAVRLLLDEYEVDEATARADAEAWIASMREQHLIV